MLAQKPLQDIVTFTRSSSATRFNTSGVLETVGNNVPRLDYEPADVPVLGPELVTNGDFSNGTTGWTTRASSASVASGVVQITATATNYPGIEQTISGLVPGKIYVISGATRRGSCAAESALAVTGIGQSEVLNNSTAFKYSSTQFVATSTTHTIGPYIKSPSAIAGETFFSLGVSVKEIIGYTVRKGDPKGILIEEQRTNLITYSSDYTQSAWAKQTVSATASAGIAPDGTNSMQSVARSTTAASFASFGVTKSASSAVYTYSQFFKAGTGRYVALRLQGSYPSRADAVFDLQNGVVSAAAVAISNFSGASAKITPFGNGVYRCEITATSDAWTGINGMFSPNSNGAVLDGVDSVATSSVLAWGGQIEQGALASSYIPTSGSQVTRAADKPAVPASLWLKALQGTLHVEYSDDCLNSSTLAQLSSGDGGAAVWIVRGPTGVNCMINNGGLYRSAAAFGLSRAVHKAAVTWDAAGNFMSCCDGRAVASNTQPNGAPPITGGLRIGCDNLVAAWANGHIRAAKYFPDTRTAAQLQTLTA